MLLRTFLNLYRCLICQCHYQGYKRVCDQCFANMPWQIKACIKCALPLKVTETKICHHCQRHKSFILAQQSFFCFSYQLPIDSIIKSWKFNGQIIYQYFLAESLISYLTKHMQPYQRPDAIIAVPISKQRCRTRGFNQASILSKLLAKHFKLLRLDKHIHCHHSDIHQVSLSAEQRKLHLQKTFYLDKIAKLPKHIAIIDDVMTTGSTLNAIHQCLIKAGAKQISFWGIARVDSPCNH